MARKVYTLDQMLGIINEDYAWRRKELHIIKNQIPSIPGPKQNAALRFCVPILYAHWEGFVKKSCETYLEFVANKYLTHKELKSQFIALSISKYFGKLENNNIENRSKVIEFLVESLEKNSNILTRNVIQTKSNLRYNVFQEILFIIGINENKFKNKESLINDLVDSRNNIAHGDYLRVEFETFHIMFDDIQVLMEALKTELENSAVIEGYKKDRASA